MRLRIIDGHGVIFEKSLKANIESKNMEGSAQSAFEVVRYTGKCPMDEYKILEQMLASGGNESTSGRDAAEFSLERHKIGMRAFSGNNSPTSFLEINEAANLMNIGLELKKKTNIKNNNDDITILNNIENILNENKSVIKDKEMSFTEVNSQSKIKQDDPFGGDEVDPFGGDQGSAEEKAAKALAEKMKQYQNTE
jgi:hypothetical protein